MIKRFLCLICIALAGCGQPDQPVTHGKVPERIISLAPNITETLLDLGLDDRLIGISRFGSKTASSDAPVVGDFMTVNYEAVVSLRPDLVILEKSADQQKARLQSLGIPYLETASLSIDEVIASVREIGSACDIKAQAEQLVGQMQLAMDRARNTPAHRPRTLIVFSDFSNSDQVDQLYAFGSACIHSELLAIAGGDNVIADTRPSVILSREAVIRLDPELIIELSAGGPSNNWSNLPSIDAVRNHRIHVLDGTYTTIPSPASLIHTLNDISKIIRQTQIP